MTNSVWTYGKQAGQDVSLGRHVSLLDGQKSNNFYKEINSCLFYNEYSRMIYWLIACNKELSSILPILFRKF
ncbi:hypothetical protein BpHYR1_038928 [Brachionus plicatilis]|uniref:Uncharacterized protein n=1 Tax=Brachionus plicatilis TaxID=10195 RepID=A0A3M7S0K0_BRAPC|nr:hypothetical protein BpHYR1_038928 [Brachionus plicatilis]